MEDLITWATTVEINVIRLSWSTAELRELALSNAIVQKSDFEARMAARGQGFAEPSTNIPDEDRAVVTFVKHKASNYDLLTEMLHSFEAEVDSDLDPDSEEFEEESVSAMTEWLRNVREHIG